MTIQTQGPRSLPQIIGDMVATFLSKQGIPKLKVGNPILSLIEAASQSDFRNSQDNFAILTNLDLERATGADLDAIGAREKVPRPGATFARGGVTIGDSAFVPVTTRVYQGLGAPNVGTTVLNVADGSGFTAAGTHNLYIGRGTTNLEGPIAFNGASVVQVGAYWQITLNTATQNFHNVGETVTLGQGGNRAIPAGTIVQTPQANAATAGQFTTLFAETVPDGENQLAGVAVVAVLPGPTGNVAATSITSFASPPWATATVSNPAPFTNATPQADDRTYRDLIRSARAARSQGIDGAITFAVLNQTAPDENRTIKSSALVSSPTGLSTLYVDDGTGYEENQLGIALEVLDAQALGGETDFQLAAARPVTKANLQTTLVAPYALVAGAALALNVGGVVTTHIFEAAEARNLGAATAFEIVTAVNGDPNLDWQARAINNGTGVAFEARADTNEALHVASPAPLVDANTFLGLPTSPANTLNLYRNDILLSKDGQSATILSQAQSRWAAMASGETLSLSVDGTPTQNLVFTDADFLATGFASLASTNSLQAWAQVFNAKIPGVTTTVEGNQLGLTSNVGPTGAARLTISGGSLVTKGMLALQDVRGAARDYELNRNTAQLHLEVPLVAGDALTAGSVQTRAFVQTPVLGALTLATDAHLWWVVDGAAQVVPTGITNATVLTYALVAPAPAWGQRCRVAAATPIWAQVEPLDWIIFWDTGLASACRGTWRVDAVDPQGFYVDIAREPGFATTGAQTPTQAGGVVVVRTHALVQEVTVPAASNYTATTLAPLVAPLGATGTTQNTTRVRVRTNTWAGGDIALVAADVPARALGFPTGSALVDQVPQVASVRAAPQRTTPDFTAYQVTTATSPTQVNATNVPTAALGQVAAGARDYPDTDLPTLFTPHTGSQVGWESPLVSLSGATLVFRTPVVPPTPGWLVQDRFYFSNAYDFGAQDALTLVLDQDVAEKRFGINVFRNTATIGSYGTTITLKDADVSPHATLSSTFGLAFNWNDFVVLMRARGKTHPGDTARTGLWRYYRYGPEGDVARIQYRYPATPNAPVGVVTTDATDANTNVVITLPTGAPHTATVHNTTQVGLYLTGPNVQGLYELTYCLAMAIQSATRDGANNTTLTLINGANLGGLPSTITDHGIQLGAQVWVQSADVNFSSGLKTVTNRNATTITYTEVAAAAGPDTFIGTVSMDISGAATLVGGTVAVGDVVTAAPTAFMTPVAPVVGALLNPTAHQRTTAINTLGNSAVIGAATGSQFWTGATDQTPTVTLDTVGVTSIALTVGQTVVGQTSGAQGLVTATGTNNVVLVDALGAFQANEVLLFNGVANGHVANIALFQILPGQQINATTTLIWYPINAASNISFYPVNTGSNTIAQIVTAVNALATANAAVPITGVAVGDGAGHNNGQIAWATYEDPAVSGATTLGNAVAPWYPLFDGINWVQSTNTPANVGVDYQFTLKAPVTAQLGSNSDWANEDVRLIPLTAANVVAWLDAPATSGLFANAEVVVAGRADQPQVATLVTGSLGAVQVQSGTANRVTTNLLGATLPVVGTYGVSQVRASDTALLANHWVAVQNQVVMPRQVVTPSMSLTLWESSGEITLNPGGGAPAWSWSGVTSAPLTGFTWQFERWGNFMALVWAATEPTAPLIARVQEGDWVQVGAPAPTSLAVVQVVVAAGTATVYTAFPSTFQVGNVVTTVLSAPGLQGATTEVLATGSAAIAGVTYSWVQYADTASTDGTYGAPGNPCGSIAYTTPVNAANAGVFRIVRVQTGAGTQGYASLNQVIIWVENPNGVEEISNADVYLLAFDSALPGDTLNVATGAWGPNQGLWTVTASGSALTQVAAGFLTRTGSTVTATTTTPHGLLTGQRFSLNILGAGVETGFPGGDKVVATVGSPTTLTYTEAQPTGTLGNVSTLTRVLTGYPWQNQFQTRVGTLARVPVQAGPVGALGAAASLIQVIEATPSRLIKRVYSISPNQADPTLADVKWDTVWGYRLMGAAAGSQVITLDKLGFPTGLVTGTDAYAHTTGIIAEANRIIYGDPTAPAQYPGVAANQARINIRGPFVRRAQVTIAIRLVTEIGAQDIIEAVRSAVAATINAAGQGESIALSALTDAAEGVQGVESAVMVSPAATATADLLEVAPFEILKVLDASQDVLVTLIG